MKRFLSLLIALILVCSLFTVTAVASAADDEFATHKVEFTDTNANYFKTNIAGKYLGTIEMSTNFMLDGKISLPGGREVERWYTDYEVLHTIFNGIVYIELKEPEGIIDADDEAFDEATKYTVTYDMNLPAGIEQTADGDNDETDDDSKVTIPKTPEQAEYQVTEHVALAKNPILKGYVFTGWKIEFTAEGKAKEFSEHDNFPGGYTFNMPAAEVKVTAQWKEDTGTEEKPMEVHYYADDVIYILYTDDDTREVMKDWGRCDVSKDFSVTSEKNWMFRFAVVDGVRYAENKNNFDWDFVLATTYDNVLRAIESGETNDATLSQKDCTITSKAEDTTRPEVALSHSMTTTRDEGLTVGKSYDIETNFDITDASDTIKTYVVYKKVGVGVEGADEDGWLQIYDSKTGEVTEGYENNISTSGRITPLEADVRADKECVYRVVYTVRDIYGNKAVKAPESDDAAEGGEEEPEEYHPVLELYVKKTADSGRMSAIEAWKIVLYVVAGLSAAGIVALLCIKPKQPEVVDARYSAKDTTEGDSDDSDTQE